MLLCLLCMCVCEYALNDYYADDDNDEYPIKLSCSCN